MGEEINFKDGTLVFKRKLNKKETYKISKGKKNTTLTIFNKPQIVRGVASYCADGKHVLFIDYDDVPRWLVEEDYLRLQRLFKIPLGYLFTTKQNLKDQEFGNYHVICLAKFYPKEIYEMISITHADINYASMPLRNKYRNWILRIGTKINKVKPKFIGFIGEDFKGYKCSISSSHLILLNKLYPEIKHPVFQDEDKLDSIYLQDYEAL